MTANHMTFMVSSRTIVSRDFYQAVNTQALSSLQVQVMLSYIRESSLNSTAYLKDPKSGKQLASNTNQVVLIDRSTRKPTPLPDWWKKRYSPVVVINQRLVLPTLEVPATNVYKYEMKVSWLDIDSYHYTNYLAYFRFCFDAGMDAVSKGFYSKVRDDILEHDVQQMESVFQGESKAGDQLKIETWENSTDPYLLNFNITRDSTAVFQSRIKFYGS